jgi:hypothetical protein
MSLNLHLLRLFATVVRTGSFSRAADILHISQPAISKGAYWPNASAPKCGSIHAIVSPRP